MLYFTKQLPFDCSTNACFHTKTMCVRYDTAYEPYTPGRSGTENSPKLRDTHVDKQQYIHVRV